MGNYVEERHKATFLKLIEDEVLWGFCDGRKYIPYLMTTLEEECRGDISFEVVKRWHAFLMLYLQAPPSQSILNLASMSYGFFNIRPETLILWSQWIPELAQEPIFQGHVRCILKEMGNIFMNRCD